jgi:uncharacterized membrane protein YfcA
MSSAKLLLFAALGLTAAGYFAVWIRSYLKARGPSDQNDPASDARPPDLFQMALGFVTNFFDSLGIGSFATTTSVFKLRKMVPDKVIPGTLNVGHTPPTITQALIFIAIVEVDMTTLSLMIAGSVAGAWLGAGVVSGWPKRKVQIGMGLALLGAATLMAMTNLQLFPGGGNTLHLEGARLVTGVAANFGLGALMTLGIGLYAPCMILVSLLGMNPTAAFPIMMGSCAFLMPIGSIRFIRERSYSLRAAIGLAIGGVPGVLIAAFIVKSLPLTAVRWLVVIVVLYTAYSMLRSARADRQSRLEAHSGRLDPVV